MAHGTLRRTVQKMPVATGFDKNVYERYRDDCIALVVRSALSRPGDASRACALKWSSVGWLPDWAPVEFPDAGWDWASLSANLAIGLGVIERTIHALPWGARAVSWRRDVTSESVADHPDIPWDREVLRARQIDIDGDDDKKGGHHAAVNTVQYIHDAARAGMLDPDFVRRNLDAAGLDFRLLSRVPCLHDIAIEHPDLPWDWCAVAIYADIDRFVDRPDLFEARYMLPRQFPSARVLTKARSIATIQRAVRRWLARRESAAATIQSGWRRARFDPDLKIGRKFIADIAKTWGKHRKRERPVDMWHSERDPSSCGVQWCKS